MQNATTLALGFMIAILWTGHSVATERDEHRPVYSPDGAHIIFMLSAEETGDDWELHIVDADGRNLRRLTTHVGWDGYAVWSPTGTAIYFARSLSGDDENKTPYLLNLTTGETERLGAYDGWVSISDWSSDNQLLAFWEYEGQRDLYLIDQSGELSRQLTSTPTINEHDAQFSPDETLIAFASQPTDASSSSALEIMDSGGMDRRVLHSSAGRIYGVAWSPDGSAIAFTDAPGGDEDDADLFVLELASGEVRQITEEPSWDHMPEWHPNGASMLFTSYRSGEERLYEIDIESGEARPFCIGDIAC